MRLLGLRGAPLVRMAETTSTQDALRDRADAGSPEGTVVVAAAQTAGRGRDGRSWASPPGMGLYLSVLLRPPRGSPSGLLPLAAGVALARATGVGGLKWPNDLLAPDGRKLAGILAEAWATGGVVDGVLLGIGVNLRAVLLPPGLDAAALDEHGDADPEALLGRLLDELEALPGRGAASDVLAEWWARCVHRDLPVTVATPAGLVSGVASGLEPDGALRLRTPGGRVLAVRAGDVSLERRLP